MFGITWVWVIDDIISIYWIEPKLYFFLILFSSCRYERRVTSHTVCWTTSCFINLLRFAFKRTSVHNANALMRLLGDQTPLHVLGVNNECNWHNRKIHSSNHNYEIKAKSFIVLFWSNSKWNVILVQIYRDVRYGSVCQTHFDISALEIFEMKLHLTHISWDMCWAKFKWCMSLLVGKGTWHTGVLDCAIS